MESVLYSIYALVFESEISLVRRAHSFDFWYINNSRVNTVRTHFPWSILHTSNEREKKNCSLLNADKISRIFPVFMCKNNRFPACTQYWADAYSCHICRAWSNGSYTMMAKPIRALELCYPMIQFLIILNMITWKH